MEVLTSLMGGFEVAFTLSNLMFVVIGVLLGTVVGLLPGMGPTAGIAVLLPVTLSMDPASAVIMLAGIYYGAMYGSRIPSILLNIPGDASAVMTTLDGYPMRQQGKAGRALGITAIGSFIGGTIAIIGLTMFAPMVAKFAVRIGSPEMFILAGLGLLMVTFIGTGSKIKALCMAGVGLLLAAIGADSITGESRLIFGNISLMSGINIIPLAVGLFGISEILMSIDRGFQPGLRSTKLGRNLPTKSDWLTARMAVLRASIIGFFIGILPGGGGALSSILAYGAEKKFSKHPERFGKGAVDGLAATETADNSSSNAAFVPLLTLGIPPNSVLAVIFGALLLHNITPGPRLISEHPDVFWGVIASMYVGNIVLLVLNLPLIGVFLQVLRVRTSILFPIVLVVAICGVYSANNRISDVGLALAFGVFGYILKKFKFDITPLILAFILGPIIESELRRTLVVSGGDLSIFITRPISLTLIVLLVVALLILFSVRFIRTSREKVSKGVRANGYSTHNAVGLERVSGADEFQASDASMKGDGNERND